MRRWPTSPTRTPSTCASTPRSIADPERFYDRVIDIDLDELEPHLVGPHTPDLDRPISEVGAAARDGGLPGSTSQLRARRVVHQLVVRGHRARRQRGPPGERGRAAGEDAAADHARVPSRCAPRSSATACSPTSRRSARPCSPTRAAPASASGSATTSRWATTNTIVSSFNRNFPARNDGNAVDAVVHRLARDRDRDGPHRAPRRRLRHESPSPRPTARRCGSSRRSPTSCRAAASTRASRASQPPATDPDVGSRSW